MHVLCTMMLSNSPKQRIQPHGFFLRSHPGPGIPHSASVGSSTAMQQIDVEYFGHGFVVLLSMSGFTYMDHSAHAGAAPW